MSHRDGGSDNKEFDEDPGDWDGGGGRDGSCSFGGSDADADADVIVNSSGASARTGGAAAPKQQLSAARGRGKKRKSHVVFVIKCRWAEGSSADASAEAAGAPPRHASCEWSVSKRYSECRQYWLQLHKLLKAGGAAGAGAGGARAGDARVTPLGVRVAAKLPPKLIGAGAASLDRRRVALEVRVMCVWAVLFASFPVRSIPPLCSSRSVNACIGT